MEKTLPKTINSTITKSNGKEIRVIKKTKRNINSVDVVLPDGCVAEKQRTWHDGQPAKDEPFNYDDLSDGIAKQIATFKSRRNRGNRGKKT